MKVTAAMGHMLRCLFFLEAKFEFTWSTVNIPGKDNGLLMEEVRHILQLAACQVLVGLMRKLVVQGDWTPDD